MNSTSEGYDDRHLRQLYDYVFDKLDTFAHYQNSAYYFEAQKALDELFKYLPIENNDLSFTKEPKKFLAFVQTNVTLNELLLDTEKSEIKTLVQTVESELKVPVPVQ